MIMSFRGMRVGERECHEWHMLDGFIIKVHLDAMRSSYDKAAEAIGSSVAGLALKFMPKSTPLVNSSIY